MVAMTSKSLGRVRTCWRVMSAMESLMRSFLPLAVAVRGPERLEDAVDFA
jgi:hypothetical protein